MNMQKKLIKLQRTLGLLSEKSEFDSTMVQTFLNNAATIMREGFQKLETAGPEKFVQFKQFTLNLGIFDGYVSQKAPVGDEKFEKAYRDI